MSKRLSTSQKIKILQQAQNKNISTTEISKKYNISRLTFYNWKRKLGYQVLSKPVSLRIYKSTLADRNFLLESVSKHGFKVTEVCTRLQVSRTTYYKWKKKLESGVDQSTKKSARGCSDQQVKAVLSIAYCYPKYSVRKIENLLKEAGPPWILSSHGVYNVLKRYSLNTYQSRLQWQK